MARPKTREANEERALGEFLALSLRSQSRAHRKALRKCNQHCSRKAIHALRIEARRLLAHIEVLSALLSGSALTKARRRLKREVRTTSPLRDAQVQLHFFAELPLRRTDGDPQLRPLRKYLKKRRQRLVDETAASLRADGVHRFLSRLEQRARTLPADATAERRQQADVNRMLARAFARVATRHRSSVADPATLHRARVALKKMRYILELLQPLFPAASAGKIKLLHKGQSVMGDIHDLDLFLARVEKFRAKGKLSPTRSKSLIAALERRKATLLRDQQRLTRALLRREWRHAFTLSHRPPKPR